MISPGNRTSRCAIEPLNSDYMETLAPLWSRCTNSGPISSFEISMRVCTMSSTHYHWKTRVKVPIAASTISFDTMKRFYPAKLRSQTDTPVTWFSWYRTSLTFLDLLSKSYGRLGETELSTSRAGRE